MNTSATEYIETCLEQYKSIFQPDILRGKVALVTGGGSGIGFTIAEVLMRHQCDVVIASRSFDRVKTAAETLSKGTGRKCHPIKMDVRKPAEVLSAVDEALQTFGKIDFLINNAAGNFLCPLDSMSFNAFRTVIDIDTIGTFNVSKAVYDKFFKNHGGVIINITALLGHRGRVLQAHAGPAKAAIETLTRHMAVEWGPRGVRVMCVAPGPITNTEGVRRLGGPVLSKEVFKFAPIGRAGEREEIADVCLFILTSSAALLTGSTVIADGGSHLTEDNGLDKFERMMENLHRSSAFKAKM